MLAGVAARETGFMPGSAGQVEQAQDGLARSRQVEMMLREGLCAGPASLALPLWMEQDGLCLLTCCSDQFLSPYQGQISRGAHYTLQKNSGDIWEVADSSGEKISAPGVCFMIPPPDPEAIALADQYVPHSVPSWTFPQPQQPLPSPPPAPGSAISTAEGLLPYFPCSEPSASSRRDSCPPPACQIPLGKGEPSVCPLLWAGGFLVGAATHPSLSGQVTATAGSSLLSVLWRRHFTLHQHGVKMPLPNLLHGYLEGPGPTSPSKAASFFLGQLWDRLRG